MARRHKIPDAKKAPTRARIVQFVPGEGWRKRHERRLGANLGMLPEVASFCATLGLTVTVTNNGHHWRFQDGSNSIAEWWPSSAKLVFNKRWTKGVHAHDWSQVQPLVLDHFGLGGVA